MQKVISYSVASPPPGCLSLASYLYLSFFSSSYSTAAELLHNNFIVPILVAFKIILNLFLFLFSSLAALPADGPKIRGGRPRYQLGDTVRVNCTSGGFSRPPTELSWFINGDPANSAYLREYDPIVNARGLVLTRLGLEFTARPKHFEKGDLKLKVGYYCLDRSVHWPRTIPADVLNYDYFPVLGHNRNDLLAFQRRECSQ